MRSVIIVLVLGALTWVFWIGYQRLTKDPGDGLKQYTDTLQRSQRKAEAANLQANLAVVKAAIVHYRASKEKYPSSLQDLVDAGFLDRLPDGDFSYHEDTGEVSLR